MGWFWVIGKVYKEELAKYSELSYLGIRGRVQPYRGLPGRQGGLPWDVVRQGGADTSSREGEAHRTPGGPEMARDAWGQWPRRDHSYSGEPIHRT